MASVTMLAPDGTRSLLAFTSTESLRAWRVDARPIAAEAWRVAQATLAEGADVLLVDSSGPVPFAVEGAELRALALGADPTLPPHLDDAVAAAVGSVCAAEPAVLEAWLEAGAPTGVRVVVVVDDTIPIEDFRALVPRLNGALAASAVLRARAGALQVALVPPSTRPESGVVVFRRG
jgi:SseB protein N-terminal domain